MEVGSITIGGITYPIAIGAAIQGSDLIHTWS
jgi:hypothetical protein